ncbi:MAG: STAS domain-containing protein [Spirochaetaceae bacterium]|nr:MAG: STAS domain-containing protein [Spirochaetaceae bacterium]
MFRPKILTSFSGYSLRRFATDSFSGMIVGVIAVPLSIAVAVASGVTPQQGLATAVVAGVVVAVFGGGPVQVSGPTGTFVVLAYAIGVRYGYAGLALATMMAGVMLAIMGLARFGRVIQYVPYPVVIGFSSGIATVILVSQVGDLLGLSITGAPPDVVARVGSYIGAIDRISAIDAIIAAATIGILAGWKYISQRVPAPLVAIVAVTLPVALFDLPAVTIYSRFGDMPRGLPWYGFPPVSWELIRELFIPAFTIALLCGIESLFTAVVADGMVGDRHDPNTELIAEGAANFASALFGGIPASGAIARTATNAKNGGRTPVAAIANALVVFLTISVLAPLAGYIPIAALAGVLTVVAYNMAEWRSFAALAKGPKSDMIVLLSTFSLTVLVDLSVAIQVGMVLAAFLFMRRMSIVAQVTVTRADDESALGENESTRDEPRRVLPKGVELYQIDGPFFFGAAEKFRNAMLLIERRPRVRIVRMRNVGAIDATGLRLLEDLVSDSDRHGGHFILCGLQAQPERALTKSGLRDRIGAENITATLDDALARAAELSARPGESSH